MVHVFAKHRACFVLRHLLRYSLLWNQDWISKILEIFFPFLSVLEFWWSLSQALFLCMSFFVQNANVHLYYDTLLRLDKCQEMSQIFKRTVQTFVGARSLCVIFKLGLRGKINVINDIKTPELARSSEETSMFVIICCICQDV